MGRALRRRYREPVGTHLAALTGLVLAEAHATIGEAIAREKMLKAWKRPWKIELIESASPQWHDLFETIQG
jgi:putative endonuclease